MALLLSDRYPQVATLALATPAHIGEDWAGIVSMPTFRGDDWIAPGTAGETFLPRVKGAIRFELGVVVFGDKDPDGNAYAAADQGLQTNLDLLWTAIDTTSTTVEIRDVYSDGTYRSADAVIIPGAPKAIGPNVVRVVLAVKIPTGTWT